MLRDLLLAFIKRHALSYISGILILLCCVTLAMRIPGILGGITDDLAGGKVPPGEILSRVVFMMTLVLLVFGLKFVWRWFLNGNSRGVEIYLRGNLF
ncbi:MAG: ABC transporter ATP-binding protein, partial [Treponema sp.]|nr:ABC transporter ATP-binding protein [Treponema sp.]